VLIFVTCVQAVLELIIQSTCNSNWRIAIAFLGVHCYLPYENYGIRVNINTS